MREHGADLVDLGWGHRAVVAEFIQAGEPGERRHVGGEPEHGGSQALSLDVEVPQSPQSAQLLQALLGVDPVEERQRLKGRQFGDAGQGRSSSRQGPSSLADPPKSDIDSRAVSSAITDGASSPR